MNLSSDNVKNYLFLAKRDSDYNDEIYKLCFDSLQSGQTVLLLTITNSRYDLMQLAQEQNFSKEHLKRFIIMYFTNIADLTRKLLELWTLQPDFVIVDLGQSRDLTDPPPPLQPSLQKSIEDAPKPPPLLQSICFCIASLFSFMNSMRLSKVEGHEENPPPSAAHTLCSLVVLPHRTEDFLSSAQIEILINLYFYKNNSFDDFATFKTSLLSDKKMD